jgi:hypothetical protein
VLDIAMPKVRLQRVRVMAGIGEGEAAGVPEHMGMGLEIEAGFRAGPLQHLGEASSRERAAGATETRRRKRLRSAKNLSLCK